MKNYTIGFEKHFGRSYGNESTHLTLSDKAAAVFSDADPLEIMERYEEGENGYIYDVIGCVERAEMTEEEVNAFLESISEA